MRHTLTQNTHITEVKHISNFINILTVTLFDLDSVTYRKDISFYYVQMTLKLLMYSLRTVSYKLKANLNSAPKSDILY